MRFSESAYCQEWLKQFDPKDTLTAKSVLDSMWFISTREVCRALWENIESVLQAATTKRIALFPVSNKEPGEFGSEHQIGYLLEHLKEFIPEGCSVNPTERELLSGDYSHIFLVEDITGSGRTLHSFCKKFITPKLRSRFSSKSKTLELHISCFCAYEHAIKYVLSASKTLNAERFHACIELKKGRPYFSEVQKDFLVRARKGTSRKFPPLGYKETGCPVVFEHSCPNNTPAILHHNGADYRALFPNKKIPPSARELFTEVNRTPVFNLLTTLGIKNLQGISALNLRSKEDFYNFTTYLKLFSRGVKISNFQRYLVHTTQQIRETHDRLLRLGLIQSNDQISSLGKDMLKKIVKSSPDPAATRLPQLSIYIPQATNKIRRGDQ